MQEGRILLRAMAHPDEDMFIAGTTVWVRSDQLCLIRRRSQPQVSLGGEAYLLPTHGKRLR